MTASILVHSARRAAGLTQATVARRARTSATALSAIEAGRRDPSTSLLERLLNATGPTALVVAPGVWIDAARAIDRARLSLAEGSVDGALRAWLDLSSQLDALDGLAVAGAVLTPPGLTGEETWDAAFAGLVRHHLTRHRLPVPAWVDEPARRLEVEQTLEISGLGIHIPIDRGPVPPALLEHGIVIDEAWLSRGTPCTPREE